MKLLRNNRVVGTAFIAALMLNTHAIVSGWYR